MTTTLLAIGPNMLLVPHLAAGGLRRAGVCQMAADRHSPIDVWQLD